LNSINPFLKSQSSVRNQKSSIQSSNAIKNTDLITFYQRSKEPELISQEDHLKRLQEFYNQNVKNTLKFNVIDALDNTDHIYHDDEWDLDAGLDPRIVTPAISEAMPIGD